MDDLLIDYLERTIGSLIDPSKRIFLGHLLCSLGIALMVLCLIGRYNLKQSWDSIFSRQLWWVRSTKADYKILLINQLVMIGVIPRLVSTLALATFLFEGLHLLFDGRIIIWPTVPNYLISMLFTACLFILDDFSRYLVHRTLHQWPVLWSFHKVHHTAETLTPFTVFRTHPVEGVIFALRFTMVQAILVAGFMYFFGNRFELIDILGANAFMFIFNFLGANLRHSPVWITYGEKFEKWFLSPAQHQIHHSEKKQHLDCNFGTVFAIWDRMGETLLVASREADLEFGSNDKTKHSPHDLKSIYIIPFQEAISYLITSFTNIYLKLFSSLNHRMRRWFAIGSLCFSLGLLSCPIETIAQELNIYSHRQPFLIQPFIDAYEAKTGTQINIVYASKGLIQRLQMEGDRSPADVVLTVDIGRLHLYADKNLLASVDSDVLRNNVPVHLRDPEDRWFAFSKRARIIAVSKTATDATLIKRYEDLANKKWRGRICSRPGSHVYNRALVASIINAISEEEAERWADSIVSNLARRPQGNDRAQVKAIYEGVCDIAIINNYYFGKLKHSKKKEHRNWAAAVKLIFPNQDDRGTHINISGGGIAKHSPNKEEAVRFLEFLTTEIAQNLYGSINFEYPVNPRVSLSDELASWGKFVEDHMPISRVAELAPSAQMIIDRVGW